MPKIQNVQIYGLDESIYRSGYPMMKIPPTEEEFNIQTKIIKLDRNHSNYVNPHIKRAIKLANAKGGGHNQFLTGIHVDFDLTISNKCWIEAERYVFLNFISSMSSMHRVAFFPIGDMCNKYVSNAKIAEVEKLQSKYNYIDGEKFPEAKKEAYLELLYNIPSGFELMAGMTTNYRCLKNIYEQRRCHRLPDWHMFCNWIETLPMAEELIIRR